MTAYSIFVKVSRKISSRLVVTALFGIPWMLTMLPAQAGIDNKDIAKASQIFCDSLKAGKSVPDANDAATDYLAGQMSKKDKPNYAIIRQQMRQGILKICPEQAPTVRSSQQK